MAITASTPEVYVLDTLPANVGHIEETTHVGPYGIRTYTRRLDGGPYFFANVGRCMEPGERVFIDPWHFRYVGFSIRHLADIVVLDSTWNRLRVWWYMRRLALTRVKHRLILTAYVWGLTDREMFRRKEPAWRDVRFLRPIVDWKKPNHPWWPHGHAWQDR
jgi:hypothetical protein